MLNKELKHNVKSTIKDYKASNGKMHTVHEAEVVEAEVVEDDDIPVQQLRWKMSMTMRKRRQKKPKLKR